MGGNSTKAISVNDLVNKVVINALQESSQICGSSTELSPIISASGHSKISGVKQNVTSTINFDCLQSTDQSSDIQQKLKEEIDKTLSAQTTGSMGLLNDTEVASNVKKVAETVSNISLKSYSQCFASVSSGAQIKAEDNSEISDATQDINVTSVASCIQNNKQATKAIADLQSSYKERTEAIADYELIGSLGAGALFVICCICSIIISIVAIYYSDMN